MKYVPNVEAFAGIGGIIILEIIALIKGVDGVALSLAIGSIASIVTALITKKIYKK
ncbi:MAG: hypothetical protein K6T16_01540 [Candidatus Pacearchaeota archaeon]|nr:hypothetical protein [Candidatus Pacearchaeota archaeon]